MQFTSWVKICSLILTTNFVVKSNQGFADNKATKNIVYACQDKLPWTWINFASHLLISISSSKNRNVYFHIQRWKWKPTVSVEGTDINTLHLTCSPGSVTWLATKYLKNVSWRNHAEKLTTWWPQNISFWPKINIPSSYFTILMLSCLQNTLKLQFDSNVTAVRFLT